MIYNIGEALIDFIPSLRALHEKSTSESKARWSVHGTLLRVRFCETVHSYAMQQNAKELSASRALLHPLKIAVIRKSPASRQTAWCWACFCHASGLF